MSREVSLGKVMENLGIQDMRDGDIKKFFLGTTAQHHPDAFLSIKTGLRHAMFQVYQAHGKPFSITLWSDGTKLTIDMNSMMQSFARFSGPETFKEVQSWIQDIQKFSPDSFDETSSKILGHAFSEHGNIRR